MERQHPGHTGSVLAPALHRQLTVTPYPGASEVVGELTIEGDESLLDFDGDDVLDEGGVFLL